MWNAENKWNIFFSPCQERQLPEGQAKTQLLLGAEGSSGSLCHRPDPRTEPSLPCDPDKTPWKGPVQRQYHLESHMKSEGLESTIAPSSSITHFHLPLDSEGTQKERLMTPSRSWMGTSDLRMALMRRASPLPPSINCQAKSINLDQGRYFFDVMECSHISVYWCLEKKAMIIKLKAEK